MEQHDGRGEGLVPAPPVIETASATTSPHNSESGPFAYILGAIVVALLVFLATGLASCASALGGSALLYGSGLGSTGEHVRVLDEDPDLDDLDDLEELEELVDLLGGSAADTVYNS